MSVQRIRRGPGKGRWVYTNGKRGFRRRPECCTGSRRDAGFGHATAGEAFTHMREKLLAQLRLDARFRDWTGCQAPHKNGHCGRPTRAGAEIGGWFREPLCAEHRNRVTVETMWHGPG